MNTPLRLVIFDVDGTLVDSQADIIAAMGQAFGAVGAADPSRDQVLGIVGLSLDVAMPRLAPGLPATSHATMIRAYKDAYVAMRAAVPTAQSSPLYPGAMDVLRALQAMPDVLLGVATGKSKRGLDKLIEGHGLEGLFVTRQVADFHPSKPHPSMILQAMAESGTDAAHTVMVGDTSFDMAMAAAANVCGIGVSWGYHPVAALTEATHIADSFHDLPDLIAQTWSVTA